MNVVKRTMRDKIRLALTTNDALTQREMFSYISKKLDSDVTIITFYLTLRVMVNEGLVLKSGDQYSYKSVTTGLL